MLTLVIAGAVLVGVASVAEWGLHFAYLVFMLVGLVLNQVHTEVELGARSLRILRTAFGRRRDRATVAYDEIAGVHTGRTWWGRPRLMVRRADGSAVVVSHGTADDLERLRAAIEARRPEAPVPVEAVAGAAAVRALATEAG